jgi:RNA polymerase sigma-70 factor (ECF subfamily)
VQFVDGLYADHRPRLFAYVLRRSDGDYQRAEDIVQETLTRAWLRADQVMARDASVGRWLLHVARNAMVDAHRARRARPREVASPTSLGPRLDDHTDGVLTSIVVRQALAKVSPAYRAALVEVYYRGRSMDEAAGALGIAVGTVKSRLHYGLRALRRHLEPECVG